PGRDLVRERRAGQHGRADVAAEHLGRDAVRQEAGVELEALRRPDDAPRRSGFGERLERRAKSVARDDDQRRIDAGGRGAEVGADRETVGKRGIRQVPPVPPLAREGRDRGRIPAPQRRLAARARALDRERRAPRAGAEDRDPAYPVNASRPPWNPPAARRRRRRAPRRSAPPRVPRPRPSSTPPGRPARPPAGAAAAPARTARRS